MDVLGRLNEKITKLQGIEAEIEVAIQKVIQANERYIVSLNADDQLYRLGIDNKGISIMSYMPYRVATLDFKRIKNQPTDRVTLKDTGDFHYSFRIEYNSTGFKIVADDRKATELLRKYGEDILGLTAENVNKISINYIAPEITKLLENI